MSSECIFATLVKWAPVRKTIESIVLRIGPHIRAQLHGIEDAAWKKPTYTLTFQCVAGESSDVGICISLVVRTKLWSGLKFDSLTLCLQECLPFNWTCWHRSLTSDFLSYPEFLDIQQHRFHPKEKNLSENNYLNTTECRVYARQ